MTNLEQAKPVQVREWLDELREGPGWALLKERIETLTYAGQLNILRRDVSERDSDFFRGEVHAYQRVLGMCKELLEEVYEKTNLELEG